MDPRMTRDAEPVKPLRRLKQGLQREPKEGLSSSDAIVLSGESSSTLPAKDKTDEEDIKTQFQDMLADMFSSASGTGPGIPTASQIQALTDFACDFPLELTGVFFSTWLSQLKAMHQASPHQRLYCLYILDSLIKRQQQSIGVPPPTVGKNTFLLLMIQNILVVFKSVIGIPSSSKIHALPRPVKEELHNSILNSLKKVVHVWKSKNFFYGHSEDLDYIENWLDTLESMLVLSLTSASSFSGHQGTFAFSKE
jgi:hypothetical protein